MRKYIVQAPIYANCICKSGHTCCWAKSLQQCPTLCDPMDCSPPGSSVHGILHAMPSSRGSSQPRGQTHVSYVPCMFLLYNAVKQLWTSLPPIQVITEHQTELPCFIAGSHQLPTLLMLAYVCQELPWRRERLPTPVFWPREFHGLHSVWGGKESDTTEQLSLHFTSQVVQVVKNLPVNAGGIRDMGSIPGAGSSPGGGHDNPLQYSCLENFMDRGAWQSIVHGITKSQTQLKLLSTYVCQF